MLDLFDFGGDENADVVPEPGQEQVMDKPNTTSQVGNQPPASGASGDVVIQSLITGDNSR